MGTTAGAVLLETEPRLFIAGAGEASPRNRFRSNVLKRPAAIPRYQINRKRLFLVVSYLIDVDIVLNDLQLNDVDVESDSVLSQQNLKYLRLS
jgi:hypothetical protein